MGTAEEDREGVASAGVHGVPTSQPDDFMSEAGLGGSDELTRLSCTLGASLSAVAILSSIGAAAAVRKDRHILSIRRRTSSSWSFLHSFVSFVHVDLADFCCVAQLDLSSMGAVGRQLSRLWCREHGSAFANIVEARHEDCIFREGATSGGVDIVIVAVTVVCSRSTAVAHSEGDGYV
jgi:hypothetical protein